MVQFLFHSELLEVNPSLKKAKKKGKKIHLVLGSYLNEPPFHQLLSFLKIVVCDVKCNNTLLVFKTRITASPTSCSFYVCLDSNHSQLIQEWTIVPDVMTLDMRDRCEVMFNHLNLVGSRVHLCKIWRSSPKFIGSIVQVHFWSWLSLVQRHKTCRSCESIDYCN